MSDIPSDTQPRKAGWDAARLDALVDGTIAMVLTLIVLDLKVPIVPEGESGLPRAVLRMWPTLCCHLMAFFSAGMLWIGHRSQFHFVGRTTRHQLWINLFFLLWVSLMPFSTALITAHPGHWLPAMLYGVDVSLAGLALQWNWMYACKSPHLFGIVPNDSVRKGLVRRVAIGQMAYAVGIVLATASGWLSIGVYLLVPTLYLLPSAVDQRWHVQPEGADECASVWDNPRQPKIVARLGLQAFTARRLPPRCRDHCCRFRCCLLRSSVAATRDASRRIDNVAGGSQLLQGLKTQQGRTPVKLIFLYGMPAVGKRSNSMPRRLR